MVLKWVCYGGISLSFALFQPNGAGPGRVQAVMLGVGRRSTSFPAPSRARPSGCARPGLTGCGGRPASRVLVEVLPRDQHAVHRRRGSCCLGGASRLALRS